jgi:hypothetical protein
MPHPDVMDKLVSLCKRRGFIFQSSEIYGGTGSVWDYGPLGVELKKNLKDSWWRAMVRSRDDIEGLDAAIPDASRVWRRRGTWPGSSIRSSTAGRARGASAPTSSRTHAVRRSRASSPASTTRVS